MTLGVAFTPQGWDDFKSWSDDKRIRRKLDRLIDDLRRDPDRLGIGKPERLKGPFLGGFLAVRIDQEHRFVYQIENEWIRVISCRGHYPSHR